MIDPVDLQLLETLSQGLPITHRPYAAVGEKIGLSETEVLNRLSDLKQQGLIKRLGIIVKHRRLGYTANAMVVFDIPDALTGLIGPRISRFDFVTLCYRRPRQGREWPYNIYCMIHGKNRDKVLQQIDELTRNCQLGGYKKEILFSRSCYKQTGAIYQQTAPQAEALFANG